MKEYDDLSLKKLEKYECKRSDITWETGRAGTLTLWTSSRLTMRRDHKCWLILWFGNIFLLPNTTSKNSSLVKIHETFKNSPRADPRSRHSESMNMTLTDHFLMSDNISGRF